jgi:hypothetical protein
VSVPYFSLVGCLEAADSARELASPLFSVPIGNARFSELAPILALVAYFAVKTHHSGFHLQISCFTQAMRLNLAQANETVRVRVPRTTSFRTTSFRDPLRPKNSKVTAEKFRPCSGDTSALSGWPNLIRGLWALYRSVGLVTLLYAGCAPENVAGRAQGLRYCFWQAAATAQQRLCLPRP